MVHGESHLMHGMACRIPYRVGIFCWNVIVKCLVNIACALR